MWGRLAPHAVCSPPGIGSMVSSAALPGFRIPRESNPTSSDKRPAPSRDKEPKPVLPVALPQILEPNNVIFVTSGAQPALNGKTTVARRGFKRHRVQGAGFALADAVVIGRAFALRPRQYPVVGTEKQAALAAPPNHQASPARFQGLHRLFAQPVALVDQERDFAAPDLFGRAGPFGPAFPARRAIPAGSGDRARGGLGERPLAPRRKDGTHGHQGDQDRYSDDVRSLHADSLKSSCSHDKH